MISEFREWCQSDHGAAVTSLSSDGRVCEIEWFLSRETVEIAPDRVIGHLIDENGDPVDFEIDRAEIENFRAVGADLDIETSDGTIRIKRDRNY